MNLKAISWNLHHRTVEITKDQADYLISRKPDVVILEEVGREQARVLEQAFARAGLSFETALSGARKARGPHALGVAIAARFPMTPQRPQLRVPNWRERILICRLKMPQGSLYVTGAYVPPGTSNGWAKVKVLEALYDFVFNLPRGASIIAGDLNTPQAERSDGGVVTWAQRIDRRGRVKNRAYRDGHSSGRWDRAERGILQGLPALGYRDVFRSKHGYAKRAFSWRVGRQAAGPSRRYDHVFASEELATKSCEYLNLARPRTLSDHAPIEAVFEWRPRRGGR